MDKPYERLPFGGATNNTERYVKAWYRLTDVLQKHLGPDVYVIWFDPGVLLGYQHKSWSLEMWQIKLLLKSWGEEVPEGDEP